MEKIMKRSSFLTKVFGMMAITAANVYAEESAAEKFYTVLEEQTNSYIVPSIILIIVIASAITYMKTKDWTVSLVTGAISAAIIGGVKTLVDAFQTQTF